MYKYQISGYADFYDDSGNLYLSKANTLAFNNMIIFDRISEKNHDNIIQKYPNEKVIINFSCTIYFSSVKKLIDTKRSIFDIPNNVNLYNYGQDYTIDHIEHHHV